MDFKLVTISTSRENRLLFHISRNGQNVDRQLCGNRFVRWFRKRSNPNVRTEQVFPSAMQILNTKLVEVYDGRDDRLLFRKAKYGLPSVPSETSGSFSDILSDSGSRAGSPSSESGSHNSRGTVTSTVTGAQKANGRPAKPSKHRASLKNSTLLNERLKRRTEEGGPVSDRGDAASEVGSERSGTRGRKKSDTVTLPVVKMTEK